MTDDIKEYIADEAKRIVTGARRQAYGKPEQNFERIATMWNAYLEITGRTMDYKVSGHEAELTPLDVAAMMRLMKEARLAETPDHLDSYQDIVGYALCGAEVAGCTIPTPQREELWDKIEELQLEITELRRAAPDPSPASTSFPATKVSVDHSVA